MSHSLHRTGSVEDLNNDYVILSMAALRVNKDEAPEKLKKISKIMADNSPLNMGDAGYGSIMNSQRLEDFRSDRKPKVLTAVYDEKEKVKAVLSEIKDQNLKVSVVVSGLISEVDDIVKDIGLELHTVNISSGIFGKTDRVCEDWVLEFTSMCGHHLIAPSLVRTVAEQYKSGKISMEKAVSTLGSNCICGIFNTRRAEELLERHCGKK